MSLQLTTRGEDVCGKFVVQIPGTCGCTSCLRRTSGSGLDPGVDVAVKYISWRHEIPIFSTLLRKRATSVGVDCGCYGKLHRQIAHIMDKRGQKGNPV